MITLAGNPSTIGKVRDGKGEREIRVLIVGRAAIYIRVSSHRQEDGASLEVQLEACRRYCEANGLEVVAEFKDVQTGLDVDRPQYQQALSMARTKGFDKLVVYRYDRSGRDDAEYAGMLKDFAKLGIALVSASGESPDPFSQKLAGLLAWDESRRISIRVTGSKMKRYNEGKWSTGAPFGYSTDKAPDGGRVLVTNDQSPLVTEMFTRYASGKYSLADIQRYLRENGYFKSRAAISYILKNPVYAGIVQTGKWARSPFMPKPDVTHVEGRHQALVDMETFDLVQVRLSNNKSRQRGGPTPKYLFSGLIYCGVCGNKYTGRRATRRKGKSGWVEYNCNRRWGVGDCQSHCVHETRIRAQVIPPIEALLRKLQAKDVRAAVREELTRQQQGARAATQQTKENLEETQKRLEAQLTKLEDSYLDGDLSRDRYLTRRDEIVSQLADVRAQQAERPHLALPNMEQLFALADALEGEPPDDAEWRHIIEGTLARVVIEGHEIHVEWQEWVKPLFSLGSES
jgi:site-specific DNA recombinase